MKKNILLVLSFLAICSCIEARSAQPKSPLSKDLQIFSDKLCTKLSKKATKAQIANMDNSDLKSLAESLLTDSYSTQYRVSEYKSFLCPDQLGRTLQIGDGYSKYENMTGIYLEAGNQTIIAKNIGGKGKVTIKIPDWQRHAPEGVEPTKDPAGWGLLKDEYEINNGVNVINVKKSGLVYVDYYSNTPQKENVISLHFVNDKVNGYFDLTKHNNHHWDSLLKNAVYPVLDARGRHIQVAYPVEALVKYAHGKGVELLSNYDSLIRRQHRFIGLEKYNRIPENRILARVNYNYYMFRDGDGVAYMGTKPGYAMAMVADPARVISGDPCWGFSHEVGHVHQLRPYLNWGGLGEVSNNIITMYVIRSFGVESRLAKQDDYNKARKNIIDANVSYLKSGDAFSSLVPFWQLHLYFAANNHADFYADLHEVFRNMKNLGGQGWDGARGKEAVAMHQLNFVKQACIVGKTDLRDFFDKWGFFKVGEFEINDYGKFQYKMTQEMVDACKNEIEAMNLPKPKTDPTTFED